MGFDLGIGEAFALADAGVASGASTFAAASAADATASFGAASLLPSLSSVATAASVGSSLVSGLGAIQQSRASAASAGYNAKVAEQNAQLATQNAEFAGSQGNQEVGIQGARNRAALATLTANQGASGVDINSGSSVDTRESEAKLGMLNALTIRSNAAKEAYGYQVSANSDAAQAQLLRQQQKYDKTSGYINAASNVLGGVGQASMYSKWLNSSSPLPVG